MGYGVWLHGEAVAAGTVMALEMSMRLGWISQAQRDRGIRLFQRAGLPVVPPAEMTPAHFMEHMAVDKRCSTVVCAWSCCAIWAKPW